MLYCSAVFCVAAYFDVCDPFIILMRSYLGGGVVLGVMVKQSRIESMCLCTHH